MILDGDQLILPNQQEEKDIDDPEFIFSQS